jgi:hypothetical protein
VRRDERLMLTLKELRRIAMREKLIDEE